MPRGACVLGGGEARSRASHLESAEHLPHTVPLARTLEVFRREGDRWVLANNFAGDQRIRTEPFEAVELELEALWPPA